MDPQAVGSNLVIIIEFQLELIKNNQLMYIYVFTLSN